MRPRSSQHSFSSLNSHQPTPLPLPVPLYITSQLHCYICHSPFLVGLSLSFPPSKMITLAISLSTLLLLLLTPTPATSHLDSTVDYNVNVAAAASYHCDGTLYPDLCASTLTSIPNLTTKKLPEIISHACNQTVTAVESSASNCSSIYRRLLKKLEPRQRMALTDCLDLMDETVDELRRAVVDLSMSNSTPTYARLCEIRSVLSASITNQYTCLDGFAYNKGSDSVRPMIEKPLYHISHMVSNSLAMAKKFHPKGPKDEPLDGYGEVKGEFPEWLTRKDRRLLQTAAAPTANLTVAKDGSGNFTTIGAALAVTPNNSATRFVIYIKAGAYLENVEVGKKQINVMFVGDGIGKTVIKASRNVVDGWTTFRSATVAVVGTNFLGRDLTIENSAGPSKHQAVALRVGADLSAFYRCSFVGYQDTLYVHTLRQFFRECDIYGTVDFIFGNSAVVFQNCSLYARKPDPSQKNIFTAQGREDPNQNTGISIQSCKVAAASDLLPVQSTFQSYLGRPWKQYSRTVFMQSQLDSLIDPAGWLEWNGTFALDTLYYGEYRNFGPGSSTANRVNWPGYRVINSSAEASQFTVASFIQGTNWLPATIPFTSGLS